MDFESKRAGCVIHYDNFVISRAGASMCNFSWFEKFKWFSIYVIAEFGSVDICTLECATLFSIFLSSHLLLGMVSELVPYSYWKISRENMLNVYIFMWLSGDRVTYSNKQTLGLYKDFLEHGSTFWLDVTKSYYFVLFTLAWNIFLMLHFQIKKIT